MTSLIIMDDLAVKPLGMRCRWPSSRTRTPRCGRRVAGPLNGRATCWWSASSRTHLRSLQVLPTDSTLDSEWLGADLLTHKGNLLVMSINPVDGRMET